MSSTIIVKRVRIRNILSHEDTEVRFPLGLIALIGPNGAGKSSIVDSMVYALFFNPQSAKGFRGGRRSLLRVGANEGLIEVELNVGGKSYIIQRTVSSARPEYAVLIEIESDRRRVLASGVSKVLEFVEKILGIPSLDSIRYTIISRQNELTSFLDETASSRREIVLRLLGLDEIEKAKDVLREHLKKVEGDIRLFEELKKQRDEIKRHLLELNRIISEKISKRDELSKKIQALSTELKIAEKVKDLLYRYNELKTVKEAAVELGRLKLLQEHCIELSKINLGELASILEIYSNAKRRIDELNRELSSIDNRIRSTIEEFKRISGVELKCDREGGVVETFERYLDEIRRAKHSASAEASFDESSIDMLKNSAVCPLCKRELSEGLRNELINRISKRVEELKVDIQNMERIEAILRGMLSDVKKYDKAKTELLSKIAELEDQMNRAASKYSGIQQEVRRILGSVRDVEEFRECFTESESSSVKLVQCLQRKAIEIMKLYSEKVNMIKRLRMAGEMDLNKIVGEFNAIKSELLSLNIDPDEVNYSDIEVKYRELSSRYYSISQELSKLNGEIDAYSRQEVDIESKLKYIEERLKELSKSVEIHRALDVLVNKLLGRDGMLARILTKEARRLIEIYTNKVLIELGLDFTVSVSEDFNIDIRSSSGELDVRSLSGGEMVALAIALRIATAYTVFGRLPGFFVLDEPTQFLDAERRRTLFEIIKRLSERVPQVIVVTHDSDVIDLADKVFYVNKVGGRSTVGEKIVELEAVA
ncbi:MAG: SMC family ATPase [Ignisphaera sp.]|nr:SMC family ATPase [Ignisphaera sp.]MCX8167979.1 SMC family ATPase [Ignisphaera sp.]MDW8085991.1 SMC family ATPase [Ignisphaera sp.]